MRDLTTRRAAMGMIAATALPTQLASAAISEPDPHLAWYEEWRRLVDYMNNSPAAAAVPDIAELPEWGRHLELEHLIGTTPARTAAGALGQLRLLDYHLGGCSYINDSLDGALANALATVERLAGSADHG